MSKERGFTLIELLVTIAIAAILITLAAPSFKGLIQTNAMSSAVNTFMSDLRFARSEAVRRGGTVVMCRSDAPESSNPTCGSASGPGGNGWVSGWIVFYDENGNGSKNAAEPILRVQSAINSIDSIVERGVGSSTKFRFTGTGRLLNLNSATSLQFGGGDFSNERQRVLCVSLGGRARISGDGTTSCGTNNE